MQANTQWGQAKRPMFTRVKTYELPQLLVCFVPGGTTLLCKKKQPVRKIEPAAAFYARVGINLKTL